MAQTVESAVAFADSLTRGRQVAEQGRSNRRHELLSMSRLLQEKEEARLERAHEVKVLNTLPEAERRRLVFSREKLAQEKIIGDRANTINDELRAEVQKANKQNDIDRLTDDVRSFYSAIRDEDRVQRATEFETEASNVGMPAWRRKTLKAMILDPKLGLMASMSPEAQSIMLAIRSGDSGRIRKVMDMYKLMTYPEAQAKFSSSVAQFMSAQAANLTTEELGVFDWQAFLMPLFAAFDAAYLPKEKEKAGAGTGTGVVTPSMEQFLGTLSQKPASKFSSPQPRDEERFHNRPGLTPVKPIKGLN